MRMPAHSYVEFWDALRRKRAMMLSGFGWGSGGRYGGSGMDAVVRM